MVGRSAADHSVVERSAADYSAVDRISQAFSTRLFMYMNSRVLLCRWIFALGGEEVVLAQKLLPSGKKCV